MISNLLLLGDESVMAKRDWDRIRREQIIRRAQNNQGFSEGKSAISNSTTAGLYVPTSTYYVNQFLRLKYLEHYLPLSLRELTEADKSTIERKIEQAKTGETSALLYLCQYFLDVGLPHWARFYFELVFHELDCLSYTEKSESLKVLESAIEKYIRNPSYKSKKWQVLLTASGKALTDGFRSALYFESGDMEKLANNLGGASLISLRVRAQYSEANADLGVGTYYSAKRDYETCVNNGDWYSKYLLGCLLLKISDFEARKGKVELAIKRLDMGKNYLQQASDDAIQEATMLLGWID